MPIHEKGFTFVSDDENCPLLYQEIWRTVLQCFSDMQSVHIDCIYGSTQVHWLIEKRITSIPSKHTWLLATASRSIGMMIYLIRWSIPCPDLDDIIQYATDRNHLDTLVFCTSPDVHILDGEGIPWKTRGCPYIDKAMRKNYLTVIDYLLWRFPTSYSNMVEKPLFTIPYVMENNYLDMMIKVVPAVLRITSYRGLKSTAAKGFKRMVKYILDHMDTTCILDDSLPEDIMTAAAENGHLHILMILKRKKNGFIPLEAFQAAFANGHDDVCSYISKRFPLSP